MLVFVFVLCLCGLIMYNIYVTCGTQHSIVGEEGYSGIDLVLIW